MLVDMTCRGLQQPSQENFKITTIYSTTGELYRRGSFNAYGCLPRKDVTVTNTQ